MTYCAEALSDTPGASEGVAGSEPAGSSADAAATAVVVANARQAKNVLKQPPIAALPLALAGRMARFPRAY